MAKKPLLIGLGQTRVSADVDQSVEKTAAMLREAERLGLDLVCFPEALIGGYFHAHFNDPDEVDWRAVDRGLRAVRKACRACKVGAAIGASMKKDDGAIWNVFLLLSKSGRVLAEYEKCHLTSSDRRCYQPGRGAAAAEFYGARVGLQICYDQRFPELWRLLALKGVKAVLHGSCGLGASNTWKIPVVEAHIRSRAAENGYFVVSVNAAGPFQNWGSVVFDPDGLEVARCNYDREELVPAELDLSRCKTTYLQERRRDLADFVACV